MKMQHAYSEGLQIQGDGGNRMIYLVLKILTTVPQKFQTRLEN